MTASQEKSIHRQIARLGRLGMAGQAIQVLRDLADEREAIDAASTGTGQRARKPRSAKAKGRAGVVEAKEWIRKTFDLEEDDLLIQTTSVGGSDIHYSPLAARRFPFAPEVKNVESLNVWKALKQAEINAEKRKLKPVLFFRRNRSDLYVAFRADDLKFLRLPNLPRDIEQTIMKGEWE